jgi:hypothetical protein
VFIVAAYCEGGASCTGSAQSTLNAMWNSSANPCLVVPTAGQPIPCFAQYLYNYLAGYANNSNGWVFSCA